MESLIPKSCIVAMHTNKSYIHQQDSRLYISSQWYATLRSFQANVQRRYKKRASLARLAKSTLNCDDVSR